MKLSRRKLKELWRAACLKAYKKENIKKVTFQTPYQAARIKDVNMQSSTPITSVSFCHETFHATIGDLVWARMKGFPFWPSFITTSPLGDYRQDNACGKISYHVQFFNWNNESGWVCDIIPFQGLGPYRNIIAATKKSNRIHYQPQKGEMSKKWRKAVCDAEKTMGMTRSERVDHYVVPYGLNTVKINSSEEGDQNPLCLLAKQKPKSDNSVKLLKNPCLQEKLPLPLKARRKNCFPTNIPEDINRKTIKGRSYGSNMVMRLEEDNHHVPKCEEIQGIPSSTPMYERKKVGPKRVLQSQREEGLVDFREKCVRDFRGITNKEEKEAFLKLPNGLKYRKSDQRKDPLDLTKLFGSSNGGILEVSQLPQGIINHPTVRITENDQALVVSDAFTGEMIARKVYV